MRQKVSDISEKGRDKGEEHILVVKRKYLFQESAWQGLAQIDFDNYLNIIKAEQEFLPRSLMEKDPVYKQIIPYLIFNFEDKYFLMKRKSKASETRLRDKYTLGIGGHIRETDTSSNSILDWSKREFHEEVSYSGNLDVEPIGVLNDDSNSVGQVHLGFVFLLKGDKADISVKSELEGGELVSLSKCKAMRADMEEWSQIVLKFLEARR
jgi:predicted NUDIX family phosphoesterase